MSQYSCFKILFLILISTQIIELRASELTLKECGVIIGHEMGGWEFFSLIQNPHQVDRVLKTNLNFVKISLRKLKDGTWVVHHDPDITIYPSMLKSKKIQLDQVTWEDVLEMKKDPIAKIPIYKLEDFINRDQGKLCWMFTPKVTPDNNLVDLILKLNLSHRSIFTTGGVSETAFFASYPEELGLNFSGRVGSDLKEIENYQPYFSKLWAMEVDPTPNAKNMIDEIHRNGMRAYLDSMRYSKSYELFGTACKKVFSLGADITQTNRAQSCIKKMNH